MALEDVLRDLIAVITTNNELHVKQSTLMAAALDKAAKEAGAKGTTGKGAGAKADTAKTAETPATTTATAKAITVEDIKAAYGGFIQEVKSDAAESTRRKALVTKAAKSFDVAKITEAAPAKYPEVMALFERLKAGEDPWAEETDESEEDSPV